MSKIGRTPIIIPSGTTVLPTNESVVVKGPKGELIVPLIHGIMVAIKDNEVVVTRPNDQRQQRASHGLIRSLVNNAIIGVTTGYVKTLKLIGTGYRAQAQGQDIQLALGYSHPIKVQATPGVTFKVEGQDTVVITGIDKHMVGQVAANVRKLRPPEPYQGKGVRYSDEVVRRKQGKAAAK
ncbi:50S ribosomal protein L6 [Candidatus Woesebacteria bacterium]|nr:50S ribosomal protein L6 [Candidatus Woesebacteria bacterium]